MNHKGFAPILIVLLIALGIGGYLVYSNYSNRQTKNTFPQEHISTSPQPTPKLQEGSVSICGDIPDAAYPPYGHFAMRRGPKWSADCQYIAWSMWQSGTGGPGIEPNPVELSDSAGVFIYNAKDKTVTKIITPTKLGDTPEFMKWIDSNNLIFKAGQKEYSYNLQSKQTKPTTP